MNGLDVIPPGYVDRFTLQTLLADREPNISRRKLAELVCQRLGKTDDKFDSVYQTVKRLFNKKIKYTGRDDQRRFLCAIANVLEISLRDLIHDGYSVHRANRLPGLSCRSGAKFSLNRVHPIKQGHGLIAVGNFEGSIDIGNHSLNSHGGTDIVMIRYSNNWDIDWVKHFGGPGADAACDLSVDAKGSVIVVGYFEQIADMDTRQCTSAGDKDIFVMKFEPSGASAWTRQYGGPGADRATCMTVDTAGNVYLAGEFEGCIDFGGGPLHSAGQTDIFVAKISHEGRHLWSHRFGGTGFDTPTAISLDRHGDVIVTGSGLSDGIVEFTLRFKMRRA